MWNDPDIGIRWPLEGEPILLKKDACYGWLGDMPKDRLPRMVDYV